MTIEDLRNALDFPEAPWPDVDSAIYFLLTVDEISGYGVALFGEAAEAMSMSQDAVIRWVDRMAGIPGNPAARTLFADTFFVPDDVRDLLAKEYPSCL